MSIDIERKDVKNSLSKMNPSMRNKIKKSLQNLNNIEDSSYKKEDYHCKHCRDLQYIINQAGYAIPCKCKSMIDSEKLLYQSEIGNLFKKKNFENYNYKIGKQQALAQFTALQYCKSLINNIEGQCILLSGNSGAGKTHLSVAIANKVMENDIQVLYMAYREEITRLKQNIMNDLVYSQKIYKYKNTKVLIIDDLFKGKVTEADINIMFEIVNYRYLNNLPMIISTEKLPSELLGIDEGIGSRIIEKSKSYIVEFVGGNLNYRLYENNPNA